MSGATRVYATIKKTSKYRYQQRIGEDRKPVPFPVEFSRAGDAAGYIVIGNNNQYRVADLRFCVLVGEQWVVLS